MSDANMVQAGEFIVGTLLVRGIVKPEDAQRAIMLVAEELQVWLAINEVRPPKSN